MRKKKRVKTDNMSNLVIDDEETVDLILSMHRRGLGDVRRRYFVSEDRPKEFLTLKAVDIMKLSLNGPKVFACVGRDERDIEMIISDKVEDRKRRRALLACFEIALGFLDDRSIDRLRCTCRQKNHHMIVQLANIELRRRAEEYLTLHTRLFPVEELEKRIRFSLVLDPCLENDVIKSVMNCIADGHFLTSSSWFVTTGYVQIGCFLAHHFEKRCTGKNNNIINPLRRLSTCWSQLRDSDRKEICDGKEPVRFGLCLDRGTFTPHGNEIKMGKAQFTLHRTIEQVTMKRLLEDDDEEKKMETDTKKESRSARRRRRLRERQRIAARDAALVSLQASVDSAHHSNDAMVAVTRLAALKMEQEETEKRRIKRRTTKSTPSVVNISDKQLDTIADRVAKRLENVQHLKENESNVLRNRIKELEDLTKDLRDKLTVVKRKKKKQIISTSSQATSSSKMHNLALERTPSSSARTALDVLQNESRKTRSIAITSSSPNKKTKKHSKLHQQIVAFQHATDTMCSRRESAKAEALHRIKNVVRLLWPRALVLLYGSYVSGLSLPSSDIDVVINLPRDSQRGPLDEHNAVRSVIPHVS